MIAISVLMPTYNAAKYVAEAVESVIRQSFTDWELVVVDDGSTDETIEIIRSFSDERIKLICNNHDFIGSLNVGLKESSGKYIARMDADDVMHPDRLKIQYGIMEAEIEITVCGSLVNIFGENRSSFVPYSLNGKLNDINVLLLKQNPLFHSTVMMRSEFLQTYNLHYEYYQYAEDYKLWFEITKNGGVFFIEDQPLLSYRISENQVSRQYIDKQRETSYKIRDEILEYLIEKYDKYQSIPILRHGLELAVNDGLLKKEHIYEIYSIMFKQLIF